MGKKKALGRDTTGMIEVSIFSEDREGLAFIHSLLSSKGWVFPGYLEGSFKRDAWIPKESIDLFKAELTSACIPFGLEPHFIGETIVDITERSS